MSADQRNPNLKHNKAINEKRTIKNVPSGMFILACSLPLITFFSGGWLPALVVFLVIIPPLIIIHRNDEKALIIYFDKLKRPDYYSGGGVRQKELKVFRKRSSDYEVRSLKDIT